MRTLDECEKYQPEIKRMTKANSFIADGRVVYVVKKDHIGKTVGTYVAYDSHTKVKLAAHYDKDTLIKYLQGKDMSVLGVDNTRLF